MHGRARLRSRLFSPTVLGALVVLAVALASAQSAWPGPVNWSPDGLPQARVLTIRGETQQQALHHTLDGRPMQELVNAEFPNLHDLLPFQNPGFVRYAAHSTNRRVLVPSLAAAIYPRFSGTRSLQIVSLLGYVLAVPRALRAAALAGSGRWTSTGVAFALRAARAAPFLGRSVRSPTAGASRLRPFCLLAGVLVLRARAAVAPRLDRGRRRAVAHARRGGRLRRRCGAAGCAERRRRPLWLALSGMRPRSPLRSCSGARPVTRRSTPSRTPAGGRTWAARSRAPPRRHLRHAAARRRARDRDRARRPRRRRPARARRQGAAPRRRRRPRRDRVPARRLRALVGRIPPGAAGARRAALPLRARAALAAARASRRARPALAGGVDRLHALSRALADPDGLPPRARVPADGRRRARARGRALARRRAGARSASRATRAGSTAARGTPSESISVATRAFGSRPVRRQRSTTVRPRHSSDSVSISTLSAASRAVRADHCATATASWIGDAAQP